MKSVLRKAFAIVIIISWILPWILAGLTFIYGVLIINFGLRQPALGFGTIQLYVVFICGFLLSFSVFSTFVFAISLFLLKRISEEETRFWTRRFMFSFITAIPEFWREHM